MKKIFFTLLSVFIMCLTFGQSPQKMTYQAVIRDASGNLISNNNVGIRVSILQTNISGPVVFSETHLPMTNDNGLATFEIGGGTTISGSIATIDWSNGPFFIKTEVDPSGGTLYSITGTHQLLSVPYALYADVAGSVVQNRQYVYLRKKATTQVIPNATATKIISYDNIDVNGINFNNTTGTITFVNTGVYMITAHTSFYPQPGGGRKLVWFNCISALWPVRIACQETDVDGVRLTTSFLGKFNAGDQISLYVAQYQGVSTDCPNSSQAFDETIVNIEKLY